MVGKPGIRAFGARYAAQRVAKSKPDGPPAAPLKSIGGGFATETTTKKGGGRSEKEETSTDESSHVPAKNVKP